MILLELFLTFFKIGAFTFGGGYAMLPLITEEVTRHGWISTQELINFIAVSESTPGPFAVNASTFIGAARGGLSGAFAATLGVVLPSFVIILIVAGFFTNFSNNKWVRGCMNGLRPAVVAMIGSSVLSVALSVFFPDGVNISDFWVSAVIFAVCMVLALKKLHPVLIIALSAILGIAAGYFI